MCMRAWVRACVLGGTGAFPGRGAVVSVRYEIRMQYKQRDAFKLN